MLAQHSEPTIDVKWNSAKASIDGWSKNNFIKDERTRSEREKENDWNTEIIFVIILFVNTRKRKKFYYYEETNEWHYRMDDIYLY